MKEWKHAGIAVGNMMRSYDQFGSLHYSKLVKDGILKVQRDLKTNHIVPTKSYQFELDDVDMDDPGLFSKFWGWEHGQTKIDYLTEKDVLHGIGRRI
jgi:hypothetical protein